MNLNRPKLLLLFLSQATLYCCSDNESISYETKTVNSNQGIAFDTLDFIYKGPEKFSLDYFPKIAISTAKVRECEIIQIDTTDRRVARKVQFDQNGNITIDENNFFFNWENGTIRGSYFYQYKDDKIIKMKGIPEEDSKDSILTIWNYNKHGLLYSKDIYEYAKKLKPDADNHLPSLNDYEKYPTWNKKETNRFLFNGNTVTIETLVEKKLLFNERYKLLFDSLKRLKTVIKFRNDSQKETIEYTYDLKSITMVSEMNMNDGSKSIYKSKAVFNDTGEQIEKVFFNKDGTEKAKMIVYFNKNRTISSIQYNNVKQDFKYSYY